MTALKRSTPEALGISAEAISKLINRLVKQNLGAHSYMILRHGQVAAEGWWHPYTPDRRHMLFSLSKSFTSTAAGFAVQEGLLSLTDKVVSFFPDKVPASVSENLAAMTIHDLLCMGAGHENPPAPYDEEDWVSAFLRADVPKKPGTWFAYNTVATYMVSAIVEKVTGTSLTAYLKPRLFDPLGIDGSDWELCPKGTVVGGFGLAITSEEIAKFGQFLLNRGAWDGVQLLNKDWIDKATSKQIANGDDPNNDWNQGYGYQFWRCRHDAYRADGAFGQFCVVLPKQDMVVVFTSGSQDLGGMLQCVWDELLPGVDVKADGSTKEGIGPLVLPGPVGAAAQKSSDGEYVFDPEGFYHLDRMRVQISPSEVSITFTDADGDKHPLTAPWGRWSEPALFTYKSMRQRHWGKFLATPVSAWAAMTDSGALQVKVAYLESPFCPLFKLELTEEQCNFVIAGAVSLWGGEDHPAIKGRKVMG